MNRAIVGRRDMSEETIEGPSGEKVVVPRWLARAYYWSLENGFGGAAEDPPAPKPEIGKPTRPAAPPELDSEVLQYAKHFARGTADAAAVGAAIAKLEEARVDAIDPEVLAYAEHLRRSGVL